MDISCGVDPCPVILKSTCVFYTGSQLSYIGVTTNDNLQTVIEKINQTFQNTGIGYLFNNGIIQPTPFDPVQLGGSLVQNTTIGGNYTLTLVGNLQAAKHITTGGTSSQFVKGDGSLDSISYQPSGNYLTSLSGDGVADGPGVGTLVLATVNYSPGTFGNGSTIPIITVNSKGLVTSVTPTSVIIPPQPLLFIGDVVGSGETGSAVTLSLQNVNANVYNTDTVLKFAVNAKGLVTSASPVTQADINSSLGYTPVPDSRTITINGVTYNLSANRSWTVGNVRTDQTYADPIWISSLNWNKIITTPTTLSGYGITDALNTSATAQTKSGTLTALQFIKSGGTFSEFLKADGSVDSIVYAPLNSPVFTGSVTLPTAPVNPLDAATKQYVDDVSQGLHIHASCISATTTNLVALYNNGTSGVGATLTNNGAQLPLMIDGVTLAPTNRVLVKNQSSQLQNGIYEVTIIGSGSTNWVLTRSSDSNESSEINGGDFVFITSGSINDNTGWVQTETSVIIGVSNISYTQFSGAGTYQAGNGLTLTGNVFSIDTAITVDLNTVQTLTNKTITGAFTGSLSGNADTVTNGVYTTGFYSDPDWISGLAWSKISGTPTTLSGYGITDAQPTLTLTTIGSTGASTLIGATLNIPNYTLSGLGGIGGTISSGQVAFGTASNTIGGSNNLFWDNANGRLGIGTLTPLHNLHINSSATPNTTIGLYNQNANVNNRNYAISSNVISYGDFAISQSNAINGNPIIAGTNRFYISFNGNVLINTTTDAGFRLDVNGTARVQGTTTITPPALTGSEATSALDISQTWNTTGTPTGIKLNITDTASNTSSKLIDLKVNGASKFTLWNGGNGLQIVPSMTVSGNITSNTNLFGQTLILNTTNPSANGGAIIFGNTITNVNSQQIIKLAPRYNQTSGTASNTDIFLNRITTAVGSGVQRLMDLQHNSSTVFSVSPSGAVEINSTTEGFLPPRMTNAQRIAIVSPAIGLIVYCTDVTEGLYENTSAGWVNLNNTVTNRQIASYTLVLGDANKLVETNVATANDLTIPLNSTVAFPIGTKIDVVQYGAGQTTFVATSGVTIRSANNWLKMNAQYGAASLIKIGTDEWYLFGNLNA